MSGARIRAVVTDIEGTTTPIRFVHDVLFPWSRARLPALLAARGNEPAIAAALARVPGPDRLATLERWQDEDSKAEPLKTLQGICWADGYASGALRSVVYADVPPALRRWHAAGLALAVYSSGSVDAQKLLFGHTDAGDLAPLFAGFFDTTTGPKRERASYAAIAAALRADPATLLFLSDTGAELDAAAAAGWRTAQLLRPGDDATRAPAHAGFADFDAVGRAHALADAAS